MKLKLSIAEIKSAGSIASAIEAQAANSNTFASSAIGPVFPPAGPDLGWSPSKKATALAKRSLAGGVQYFINSSNGRMAELNGDGEVEWSEETAIEVDLPEDANSDATSSSFVDENRDVLELILAAFNTRFCWVGDGEWDDIRCLLMATEVNALDLINGEIVAKSVIHFNNNTQLWCRRDRKDLDRLRLYMSSISEKISEDAYSIWMTWGTSEEFKTEDAARAAAIAELTSTPLPFDKPNPTGPRR
jgi:hypothetical protein